MSESEESLLKAISHYQNGLERYMQRQDESKMLHNLGRLYKLPIKVCHLEKTGVGRTVNSLRKVEGEVGDAAKSLVAKWKEMVMQEEDNKASDCPSQEENPDVAEHVEGSQAASHIKTNKDRKNSDNEKSSSEKHHSSKYKSHSQSNSYEKKYKEKTKKRPYSSDEESTDEHEHTKNSSSENSDDMKKHKIKQKERQSDVNSKDNYRSSKESKNKSKHSSGDDDSEIDPHKSKKESKHESNDKKKHHHKSSHTKKEETSKNKTKDEKRSDFSKHEQEKKKDHKEKDSKDKKLDKHEKHKKSKHEDKTEKSEVQSCSSSGTKKERTEKNKSVKSAPYTAVMNGIGSESGTSFEDALGMCGPPPSKKKKSQHERQKYSSPVHDDEEENKVPRVLPLPKEPLENLDINISSLLPPITPHYRPLGLPVDDQPKKMLTDDEALSRVMMNKNQRTKVYSGNKVAYGKVPTLFDMCVRILQDNIDALEYTGGVPYSILKPILEKATANQLYMMEHHNPYLIDDSDELWKLHCQTEFRNKKKEEMETWRDMYMRCLDEREAKLRALTANIKQSQDKSLPVRTTKLAYVDSVAKPPRSIARKQAKNDTNSVRPSAKLATLATKGEAAKVSVPNPGSRAAERSSSGASHPIKAKKAPLMAKTLTAYKNRFRR